MEKRAYGKTGVELSVVGFGGIVVTDETPEDATKYVAEAIKRGINYFDVAPTYGNAEERLGPALEPYREGVFLACKTAERTKDEAARQLAESLKRLRTDHVDLYQFHGVTKREHVETITGKGGALEAVLEAREKGQVKYIGFSAHTEEGAIGIMERFDFDSMLFPINWVTWNEGKFGQRAYREALERGVAVLALKTLAKRKWSEDEKRKWEKCWYKPVDTYEEARDAVRFTLSKEVTAGVSPGEAELLWWMCDAAEEFERSTPELEGKLAERARGLASIFPE